MGDMSLVGPRPERAYFYDTFETYIHGFRHRLAVRPGLTGLAQVNGGYDLTPEEKIVYDMEYIQKRSVWLDMKIMFRTVGLIFSHKGAR
jgi:lipopolysaccharide/colanic/teichoic acid biosynthesis glycosyltransferase